MTVNKNFPNILVCDEILAEDHLHGESSGKKLKKLKKKKRKKRSKKGDPKSC